MILPDSILQHGVSLKDQYFDLKGLSAYSSIGVQSLRRHIREDKLPFFAPGGKILVNQSEFDRWIEQYRNVQSVDVHRIADEAIKALSNKQSEGHKR